MFTHLRVLEETSVMPTTCQTCAPGQTVQFEWFVLVTVMPCKVALSYCIFIFSVWFMFTGGMCDL